MKKHPHDASRPARKSVLAAVADSDTEALALALSPRQRAFAREYVVDFNGSAAAVRAGYSVKYPDRQASQLMKNPGVAAYIDDLTQSKQAKLISVDPEYVVAQVTAIISKADTKDGDKLRALELLARHLGMFIERTEISGKDGEAIEIKKIEEDVADFTRTIAGLANRGRKDGVSKLAFVE
jgi:phage terminase small subunit